MARKGNFYLLIRQAVERVHLRVNLSVGFFNVGLDSFPLFGMLRRFAEFFVGTVAPKLCADYRVVQSAPTFLANVDLKRIQYNTLIIQDKDSWVVNVSVRYP